MAKFLENGKAIRTCQVSVSVFATFFSVACLGVLLVGILPFYGYNYTLFSSLSSLFTIFNITRATFVYSFSHIIFASLYIWFCIAIIKKVIHNIKNVKIFKFEKIDCVSNRNKVDIAVKTYNESFFYVLLLFVLSYMVQSFHLSSPLFIFFLCAGLLSFLLNFCNQMFFKGTYAEPLFFATGQLLVLLVLLFQIFFVSSIKIGIFIQNFLRFFSVLIIDGVSIEFLLQMFVTQILIPLVHLTMNLFLVFLYLGIREENWLRFVSCRKFAIWNVSVACVAIIAMGGVNGFSDFKGFSVLIASHVPFILLTIAMLLSCQITKITAKDAPFLSEPPTKKEVKSSIWSVPEPSKENIPEPSNENISEPSNENIPELSGESVPEPPNENVTKNPQ